MRRTAAAAAAGLCLAACHHESPIPYRGVVEGFYGRPWGTEGRLSMLDFMGRYDLNLYVYGPKDDPYHTARWAEPYPEKEAADFKRLLERARKNGVRFYWAIHLGSAVQNLEEYGGKKPQILGKLEAMYDLGFRNLAVFFDDWGPVDAELHTTIINDINRELLMAKGDCGPLLVCPNLYSGDGASDYCRYMGEHADPDILLIWTGQGVCCDPDPGYAARAAENYRRPPFLWWNWPVNDYCRSQLLMGRCYGLPATGFSGIMLNPMENCQASKVALYSFAVWCQDPEHFDSAAVWEKSFAVLYRDADIAAAMRTFCRHNSDMGETWCHYHKEESAGVTDFPAAFAELKQAADLLLERLPEFDPALYWELEGWLKAASCQAAIGLAAEGLEAAAEPERSRLLEEIAGLEAEQAQAAEAAREKFSAATFADDKGRCVPPRTGTAVLQPRIDELLKPWRGEK